VSAQRLGAPAELAPAERKAVQALLYSLADDEFVLADRYVDWQVRGPTLEADISIANIAQDELGHARLWYDLLQDFGPSESELIWERPPDEYRHSTLVEQPFERGDWADCMLRAYLYDTYEYLHLEALAETSYPRIADRVPKVLAEEAYHREHAQSWLETLSADDDARARLQAALDRLFGHALTLFAPTEYEDDIVELGIRPVPLADLREQWLAIVIPYLGALGLDVPAEGPEDLDDLLPDAAGRDGTHTEHWQRQYNTFTYTYRYLDRHEANRLMPDPDDA
jgi:ring-1,2-phenylacetyl-CoA epoxidase subunit PaaC